MTIRADEQMQLSITRPQSSSAVYVQVVGDVDMSDAKALGVAAAQLLGEPGSVTYVDLGGATLVGSTLVAFLMQLADARNSIRRPLVLCRPTSLAQKVIQITGLDQVAEVQPQLPAGWPAVPARRLND